MHPHRGTLILTFGVLSLLGVLPLAPVAWWMGTVDARQMLEGTMDPSGKTATEVGRFLGMFVTIVAFVVLLGGLVLNLMVPHD